MKRAIIVLAALQLGACGNAPQAIGKPPPFNAPGTNNKAATPAAAATASAAAAGKFLLYPQVPPDYRKALTQDDFAPDPTGDVNRDPFRSYLVENTTASSTVAQAQPSTNRCAKGIVAEDSSIRDMQLWGIVQEGTRGYAWFSDEKQVGQVVREGDCLTKDKAVVKDISAGCVTLEIQPEALTGPAPAAHDERECLHPEDMSQK